MTPPAPRPAKPSSFRQTRAYRVTLWVLLVLCLVALFAIGRSAFSGSKLLKADDFVQYWAAGRVFLAGGDPYDPAQLRPLQHAAGRTNYIDGAPTIVWNPPWLLPGLALFGALPYPEARLAWFLLHLALILACLIWAWRAYSGPHNRAWAAWLVGLTFVPTLQALQVGQLGPVILALTVGLTVHAECQNAFWTGAILALLSIKPQLALPLGTIGLLWIAKQRSLAAIAGGACALLVASGLAVAINHPIFGAYIRAVTSYPPVEWATPTLGGVLRALTGVERFWLQFAPALIGMAWAIAHWARRRDTWEWSQELPLLLLVSMVTAPYAWGYDMVLLVVPLVQIAAQLASQPPSARTWRLAGAYLSLNLAALAVHLLLRNSFWFFWLPPALLAWYLWARKAISAPARPPAT